MTSVYFAQKATKEPTVNRTAKTYKRQVTDDTEINVHDDVTSARAVSHNKEASLASQATQASQASLESQASLLVTGKIIIVKRK